jgi:hypothetical protein
MEHNIWVVVFAGILWLVQTLKKKGAQPRAAEPDADEAERTRRVQAEVQRKIAERRAGRAAPPVAPARYEGPLPSPVAAPRPVAQPSWRERPARQVPIQIDEPAPAAEEAEEAEEAAALARQQRLAEQLRALNEANRAAQTRQSAAITASVAPAADLPAGGWLAELRQPQGVRRAVLLREILGPPVCFR